jgi:hypothetical protein
MAGLRGNQAWLMAAKQTVKGTAATTALGTTYKQPLTGGNISPVRETDNLSETDASRDQGTTFVTSAGVEGTPEFYVRGGSIGFWLHKALGADAPTGTTNYVHVITPSNTLPYITAWKSLGDTLWERYTDCKVGSLTISADGGQPLTASAGIQGVTTTRLTSDPSLSPAIVMDGSLAGAGNLDHTPYQFSRAAASPAIVTLGGSTTALVSSFELTIENNITRQQTDGVEPYDVIEGTREVSLGFDLIFETLDEYNKFHYGGAAGTTISPNVFTTSAVFTFTKGTNNEISFNLPSIAYTEFPVEPDAGGDPVVASVRAVAQRGASPVVTATVKNQVATY